MAIVASAWSSLLILSLLTLCYVFGELAHFLLGVLSQSVATDVHYGDQACYAISDQSDADFCWDLHNRTECDLEPDCQFIYTGQGLEYQILAGPAFSVPFTFGALFWGLVANQTAKLRTLMWPATKWLSVIHPSPFSLLCSLKLFGLCSIIASGAAALLGWARLYWHLVVLRVLSSLGESGLRPIASSLLPQLYSRRRLGLANGVFTLGVMVGYGLSFAVGNYLVDLSRWGWRACFVLGCGPGVIVGAVTLLMSWIAPLRSSLDGGEAHASTQPLIPTQSEKKPLLSSWIGSLSEMMNPQMLCLILAASLRQAGGEALSNNTQLFYEQYHPGINPGLWLMGASIVGGSVGLILGGLLSDLARANMGLRARFWVLSASQILSLPFAWAMLYIPTPWSFVMLLLYYSLAETWLGILFTILSELTTDRNRALVSGLFIFVMNNIGGLVPVLVDPLSKVLGFRLALAVMWPGLMLLGKA
eukprot:maker-scaffold84_size396325-snap-gene-0.22 protein:Tk09676 transcript:maker-scaffold84_size396325-snap-gene-0.22-mRNA-1 annotation:"hypothetical protein L798_15494"